MYFIGESTNELLSSVFVILESLNTKKSLSQKQNSAGHSNKAAQIAHKAKLPNWHAVGRAGAPNGYGRNWTVIGMLLFKLRSIRPKTHVLPTKSDCRNNEMILPTDTFKCFL